MTAFTMELKLSSNRMIEDAYLATSVPDIPIANPTSALYSAGASLVPSPVTATTLSMLMSPVTSAYLSSGLDLARTDSFGAILLKTYIFWMMSILTFFPFFSANLGSL